MLLKFIKLIDIKNRNSGLALLEVIGFGLLSSDVFA